MYCKNTREDVDPHISKIASIQSGIRNIEFFKDIYSFSSCYGTTELLLACRILWVRDSLDLLERELLSDKSPGIDLGNNCFKLRLPNSSIPIGKGGGFRILLL